MMQYIRLGDIASVAAGQGAPQGAENYTEYGTPFVKAGNLVELISGTSEDAIQKVSEEVAVNHKLKLFPKGTVLFAKSGMSCMKGYVYTLSKDCYVVSHLACITPHSVESDYLKYYFEFHRPNQLVKDASYPSISLSDIAELPIAVFDQQKRQEIIRNLDTVSGLIEKKQQLLALMDVAVKSRFIELFGDQETNPYNLAVGKLSDVADIYLGLTHTPTYVEQGRPFLSVRDISSGMIDFSNCHYITEEEFCSLPNGARPKVGDMLFCRVGTIGKPVIIPENTPEFGTFVSVGYLRKKANVNNYYLKSWMENNYFMRQVYDNVAGASQINLNTGWLKNFRILIPPIELQQQFAAFVEQTDKSKLAIQESLEKLETLKKALMQKYFG